MRLSFLLLRWLPRVSVGVGSVCLVVMIEAKHPERVPFAASEFHAEGMKLTALPSEASGLDRANPFQSSIAWDKRFREFNNGSLGTGVAVGDFDRDGWPDIAVSFKTGDCRLYRNIGDNRFEDVSEDSGIIMEKSFFEIARGYFSSDDDEEPWSQGVSFADVNNDGWLDLYVCRFAAPNRLFINQKDGTFSEEAESRGLALVDSSVMAAFCDFDRDGLLDLYLLTNLLDFSIQPDGRKDFLFRNEGDGYFSDVSDSLDVRPDTQGHSAIWWDYNADGWPDLYVANDFSVPDILYRNNRDGTFSNVAETVLPLVPYSAMGCDIADIDGDGRMDLFVADMAATSRVKDQRTMAPARFVPVSANRSLPIQRSRNCLFLATSSGLVREAAFAAGIDATDWTWSPRFEDLDNDGVEDLFVTNGMNREHHNVDLVEKIGLARSSQVRFGIVRNSPELLERDLVYKGKGDIGFDEIGASVGIEEAGVSFGSASGDFDRDGDLDFVVARYNAPPLVYRNDSAAGNSVEFELRGAVSNSMGLGAVLAVRTATGSTVKQLSNARGYQSSSEPIVHFGLGTNDLIEELEVKWPSGTIDVWRDLESGFRYSLREGEGESSQAGSAAGQLPAPRFVEQNLKGASGARSFSDRYGDTGDERLLELVLYGYMDTISNAKSLKSKDEERASQKGAGGGLFDLVNEVADLKEEVVLPFRSSRLDSRPMLVFDANEDGIPDILAARVGESHSNEGGLILYLGSGDGGLRISDDGLMPKWGGKVGAFASADFDRDGQLDIFVGARLQRKQSAREQGSCLLMKRGGSWSDVAAAIFPDRGELGSVTDALCTDVDRDGWIDIALTTDWGGVRGFRNLNGERFVEMTDEWGFSNAGSGWWSSLGAADFNSDGRMDFVIGNTGLNTMYEASVGSPVGMLSGTFGERGKEADLEYVFEGEKRYPWRTRRELISSFPELRRRIRTTNEYAVMSLDQIFPQESLAEARTLVATELRSGVLLSRESGGYTFEALPKLAQIGPVTDLVVGDWNVDGHMDIALVQNTSSAYSGPWYGGLGLMLAGNGAGGFGTLSMEESGFVVPGEARLVAAVDCYRDGWPDLLVTRNGAGPLLFENRGEAGDISLSISLSQEGANPFGYGSEIRLHLSDGRTLIAEVRSNSGYVFEPEALVFFNYSTELTAESVEVHWADGEIESFEGLEGRSGSFRIKRGDGSTSSQLTRRVISEGLN